MYSPALQVNSVVSFSNRIRGFSLWTLVVGVKEVVGGVAEGVDEGVEEGIEVVGELLEVDVLVGVLVPQEDRRRTSAKSQILFFFFIIMSPFMISLYRIKAVTFNGVILLQYGKFLLMH